MKRKSLLIMLLVALFVPLAMNGQTQLLSENFDNMSSISTSYSSTGWYAYKAGNGNNWTLNSNSTYANSGSKSAQVQYNSSNAANCYLVSTPFTVSANMASLDVSLYESVRSSSYPETFEVFFVKASDVTTLAGVASATKYTAIASASYTNTSFALKSGSVTDAALAGQSVRVVVHCTSAANMWYLYVDDITVTETISAVSCDPYSLPYSYGFETNDDINCWTRTSMNTENSGLFRIYEYENSHGGSNVFLFSSYNSASNYNQYLISPELNTNQAIITVFYYNRPNTNGNESFKVGYSTTTNDINAFIWEYDFSEITVTDWTKFEETFPAGTKYVAINYYSNYQYYLAVDDFSFTEASNCPAPTNLTVNNITNNSAVISWDGSASSYEMEYTKSGSVYNFDDGSLQGWSNLKVNSDGGEWISSDNNGGGYDYTTQAHSGECFAMSYSYVDGGAGAYNTNVYFVSPQRYEITSSSASLNFFYAWANPDYADYLEVCVSTATTPTANSFTSIWNNGGSQGSTKSGKERHQKNRATWNEVTLPLSAYNGQSIWIAFHHKANDMYEIWIDDVTVSTGNNSWIPAPEPITSPYLLEGLDSETLYSVRVKAICGGDDGESAWSTVSFTTDSPCDTPVGLSTTNITAASATLNWDGYQDSYSVKYGRLFFNDNFDDSHASGWTNGGSVYSWTGTTNYFVMLGMASSGTQYLITPELSDLVGGNILEFSQRYYQGSMSFSVGYSSTTNSTSAFTWGSEISASAAAISYTETIPTGTKYIAIRTTATNSSYGLIIDDFRIYSQTVTPSNGNTLPINGLEPNSEYYWLVQGVNCDGNGGTTRWSEEAYFTTLDGTLVTSITASDVTVAVGATATITPTVLPADATNPAVTYTSGDDAIATVNASGVVTGVAAGNTTITIAATDGSGVTATINVTVTSVDVTGITTSDVTVVNGQTATISYTVAPNNATDPSVTFTSADVTIATVDASGVVTGVSVGTTTITIASVSNPEVTATVNVTVTSNPNAVQFTVNAPATAHRGDVITVEGVLTAPTSGTYGGFTDLLMAINYDHNAFEFVNGSIVYGPVVAQAQQYNSQITNFTNVTDKIQVAINCSQEGYYVTAEGVVFSARFTVLAETGSFTFTGEPNGYENFDHEIEGGGGIEYILYEATPSTVEITGPETYQKQIVGWTSDSNGWYLISSPIGIVNPTDANKTNMVTENYDLYTFDQTHENEWVNYKQSGNFTQLDPGKGYLYAHSSTFMLTFTGYAYTGTGTFPLVYSEENPTDPNMYGWNLMGNPFGVPATVSRPYYTLNYNFEYTAVTEGQSIEPMEGVFVHLETSETDPTVTFTPTSQSTDEGDKSSSLTLNITKDGKFVDRAIVCFSQGLTLPKFQFNRNHTKVYIPQDGQDYALVRSEEMGEMPVNFKAENNGTYSLNFSSKNTEFAYLHLIDNMTGADVDLLQTQSYSFEARTTDYESRFKLVFATGNNSKDDNFAFFSNGSFIINNDGEATLQVIDVTGRIIKSASINGCTNVNVNAASGIYMLRLVNGDSVKVQKVVVK